MVNLLNSTWYLKRTCLNILKCSDSRPMINTPSCLMQLSKQIYRKPCMNYFFLGQPSDQSFKAVLSVTFLISLQSRNCSYHYISSHLDRTLATTVFEVLKHKPPDKKPQESVCSLRRQMNIRTCLYFQVS